MKKLFFEINFRFKSSMYLVSLFGHVPDWQDEIISGILLQRHSEDEIIEMFSLLHIEKEEAEINSIDITDVLAYFN